MRSKLSDAEIVALAGSIESQLIGKYERRLAGFDDKIVAMYARGMTAREIHAYLL